MSMTINKKSKKTPVLITLILAVAAIAGYLLFAFINKIPPFADQSKNSRVGDQTVNLERSQAEKDATKALEENPDLKTKNSQNDTPSSPSETSPDGKKVVNVLLTSVSISNGMVSASGFVTNIVEEGGSCTYTFSKGSHVVTKKATTLVNPTSTTCRTVNFPASELTENGTWSVSLSYTSNTAAGKSDTKELSR